MGIFHKKHARVKHRPRRHRIRAYRMLGRYTRFPLGLRHLEKLEIEQFSYEHREQVKTAYPNLTADLISKLMKCFRGYVKAVSSQRHIVRIATKTFETD